MTQTNIDTVSEIHDIMVLLRGANATRDGDYRNTHLGTVLSYLRDNQEEDKSVTLQKLALMLGMAQRQVRENYVDGLIAFGIISLTPDCKRWHWVGAKAIRGKNGTLKSNNGEDNSFIAHALAHPTNADKVGENAIGNE